MDQGIGEKTGARWSMRMMIIMIVIGIAIIVTGVLHINSVLACKAEVMGTYVKYNTVHSGHGDTHEPVFRYHIKGEEFQGRCMNKLSLEEIQKQFVVGQSYTIYVNDKKPGYFVTNRKVPVQDVIFVVAGLAFLAGAYLF